jgi:hypothetical protein
MLCLRKKPRHTQSLSVHDYFFIKEKKGRKKERKTDRQKEIKKERKKKERKKV